MKIPKQKWEEYLSEFPAGRSPDATALFARWETTKQAAPDPRRKPEDQRDLPQIPAGDGELNAYRAYLSGAMSMQEATFFEAVALREYALLRLAIVPKVRMLDALTAESLRMIGVQNKTLSQKIADLTEEVSNLKIQAIVQTEKIDKLEKAASKKPKNGAPDEQ
jgi:hypothetical protein